MGEWYDAAKKGLWAEVNWEILPDEDQVQLLSALRAAVPKYGRVDGYERVLRHDTPEEAMQRAENDVQQRKFVGPEAEQVIQNKVAAAVMLTNLEARFGDEVDWFTQVEEYAQEVLSNSEAELPERGQSQFELAPENGLSHAPELTTEAHARRALEHVADYKSLIGAARHETATDEDAEWLVAMIKAAASIGYWAGRRIQTASGKAIEYQALSLKPKAEKYERSAAATRKPREKTRNKMTEKFEPAMTHISRLVMDGHSDSAAATIVSKANKDPSTGQPRKGFSVANLRTRYRDEKADQLSPSQSICS